MYPALHGECTHGLPNLVVHSNASRFSCAPINTPLYQCPACISAGAGTLIWARVCCNRSLERIITTA
jgi:hypothetical protein